MLKHKYTDRNINEGYTVLDHYQSPHHPWPLNDDARRNWLNPNQDAWSFDAILAWARHGLTQHNSNTHPDQNVWSDAILTQARHMALRSTTARRGLNKKSISNPPPKLHFCGHRRNERSCSQPLTIFAQQAMITQCDDWAWGDAEAGPQPSPPQPLTLSGGHHWLNYAGGWVGWV